MFGTVEGRDASQNCCRKLEDERVERPGETAGWRSSRAVCSVGEDVEVVVVPPAIYLGQVAEQGGERITTGVQNVSQWQSGAYTGEISAEMARDMGCGYVLVGHSERRQLFGETDSVAAAKVEQVLLSGLVAVLCVGETLAEREAGQAEAVVAEQVRSGLSVVADDQWSRVVVAYERSGLSEPEKPRRQTMPRPCIRKSARCWMV